MGKKREGNSPNSNLCATFFLKQKKNKKKDNPLNIQKDDELVTRQYRL